MTAAWLPQLQRYTISPAPSKNSGSHFLLESWTAELNPGSKKYTLTSP
eukprot:COSAG01_NODE_6029_length_3890_cov_13.018992_1_plen_47_part_10